MSGLPPRQTMLDREQAARTRTLALAVAETIERTGFSPDLAAAAWMLVTMVEEMLTRIIAVDETIAGVLVDLRTMPTHEERRRRITARDTAQKKQRRAELAAVK